MANSLKTSWWSLAAIYAALLLPISAFFATFLNRFAGLRSGAGEYTAGVSFLAGHLPYRDYFTTAPPLNLLKSALLLKLFGTTLLVTRVAGTAERLLIAIVLFHWLRQIFPPIPSLIAGIVTLILSAGDRTDPIASYNHDAIFWAMLSGLAASYLLSAQRRLLAAVSLALASGASAALSLLTKQTVGLADASVVLVLVALLLFRIEGPRRSATWIGSYLAGCLIPVAIVTAALARMHLLHSFLHMLFIQGPAAKAAHLSDFALRELMVAWDNLGWLTLGSFALLLAGRAIQRSLAHVRKENADPPRAGKHALYVGTAALVLVALAELLRNLPTLHDLSKSAVYFTFLGLTFLLVLEAACLRKSRITPRKAQYLLFSAISWSIAFTLSLSWPAFEAMLLPGLGLLIATILDGARRRSLPFVYAALCFLVLMQVREKLDLPFGFDYQDEPSVRTANDVSLQPQLRGMRLPPATVHFLDGTVATIQQTTRPSDSIFVYPEIGLLYALSGRGYPTLSGSHNIDVVNDAFAAEEANRLRSAPPAVIIYYRETEQQQQDAERLWRGGQPSGQRILVNAVEDLIHGYHLAATYHLTSTDPGIMLYLRPPA